MEKVVKDFVTLIMVVVTLIFFILMGYWTIGVWNECRVDHSWFYCVKLVTR